MPSRFNNKGLTKYWIEIIGGVIVVVVVLIVVIFFATSVSGAVEDSQNLQAFSDYQQVISKAMTQGEQTLAPFEIVSSKSHRYYAIVFMGKKAASCLSGNTNACPSGSQVSTVLVTEENKRTLKKCTGAEIQPSLNPMDKCICLLKIQYYKGCGDSGTYNSFAQGYHIIRAPHGNNVTNELNEMSVWSNEKLIDALDTETHVEYVKVLDCARIMSDVGCSYRAPNGTQYPCTVRYKKDSESQGKPVVWIGGWGGYFGWKSPFELEKLDMTRVNNEWYVDMKPYEKAEGEWPEDKGVFTNVIPNGCQGS